MTSSAEIERLRKRLVQAIADPGHFLPRGRGMDYDEPIVNWSARAVMSILEPVQRPSTYEPKPGWVYNRDTHVAWQPGRSGAVVAGSPSFMARAGGPLIEVPGEVLYRLIEENANG